RATWDAFREEHDIDSLATEQGRLVIAAQLRTDAIMAENEAHALENRVKTLRREIERIPKLSIAQHQESTPDVTRLAEAEAALATKEARLTPAHPEVEALRRQVQILRLRTQSGQSKSISTSVLGPNT